MNKKMVKITAREYTILVTVMNGLSDKYMADKYPDFKEEMKVDTDEIDEEVKRLVSLWELLK